MHVGGRVNILEGPSVYKWGRGAWTRMGLGVICMMKGAG